MSQHGAPASGASVGAGNGAGLSASRALDLLERGANADRAGRALLFYEAAQGRAPGAEPGGAEPGGAEPGGAEPGRAAPLGDLDRAAWRLRRASIGGAAEAVAICPGCGADLDVALPAGFSLPARIADHAEIAHDGAAWRLRLPTLGDFSDGALQVERLAEGAPWHDAGFRAKAEAALDKADPGMDLRLSLACAACGAAIEEPFDAVAYFWNELQMLETRLIREVADLARAYGWSEAEILAMSPRRRALYLAEAER